MREAGLPADRLRLMPNSVEPTESHDGPDEGYVLAFGRLVAIKGFELVVDLARRRPDTRFVIAGDGPERPRLESATRDLGNVEFTGFLGGDVLRPLIRGARVVLVPSLWPEPFGMVVLEAWREGRPVVAARSGALAELVDDGNTGYTFDRGDVTAADGALGRLVDDEAHATALGQNGRRLVHTTYSFEAHLDRLEALYHELLAR